MIMTVPFVANTPDNTHCFQAALKMVIGYFEPDRVLSWEALDKLTGKSPDLWTWPMQGILWFMKQGYEVKNIELFDYHAFAEQGESYLVKMFGEEVAREQAEHSNLPEEQRYAKMFAEQAPHENRLPSRTEIKELLDEGFLGIVNVNGHALDEQEGYSGHVVVIIGYNTRGFILHDPGLPAAAHRHVSYPLFQKAWAYPNKDSQNIIAVRKTFKPTFAVHPTHI